MAESFLKKRRLSGPRGQLVTHWGNFDPVNVRRGRLGFIVSHRQHQRRLSGVWDGDCGEGGDLKGKLFSIASWMSLALCVAATAMWLTSAYCIDRMQWHVPAGTGFNFQDGW